MKKTKILTMTSSGLGRKEGISTVILDYYTYFEKEKYQLDIIASGDYSSQLVTEFQCIGVNVRYLPSRKIKALSYIKGFIQLIKKEKYDAIYLHGSSAIMSIELIIAKIYGVKIRVVHSHNTTCDHKMIDKLLRPIFYRSYTKALACGTDAGKWLYGSRTFDVIKNGRNVDVYRFNEEKRREVRDRLAVDDNTILFGHVGNFNRQKNQHYLIRIFKIIITMNSEVKLFLIGDGSTKKMVMKMVADEGLTDYVVFTGTITNVSDMLQAMDMMFLPSLHEGLPLVVIEWQIAGLPCILSDNVTRECAYTDLVSFLPLSDPAEWAKKALEIAHVKRGKIADMMLAKARENGFDLQENALILQKYFTI